MQFTWGPIVLAQLYMYLYNFVIIDKINVTIEYAGPLHIYAYEHVMVVQLVHLQRVQEDLET